MPRVDVIVLNYNGRIFLGPCLGALRAQAYRDFRVTLVDNGSSDGSVEFVRETFPEAAILALPENTGFCAGNNRGIEATGGEYVALLNNDTEPAPGWLGALVAALDADPHAGLCASKLIRVSDRRIDTAGDVFYTCGIGGKRGSGEPEERYGEPGEVFGACAGAALYRRAMLSDIGLLDEDLFAYDEDIDLSFRARLFGYRCLYAPAAAVLHHVGGSFDAASRAAVRRARRNALEVLVKNMPGPLLLRHLPKTAAYYAAGDLLYAFRGYGGAVMAARWENLARLGRTLAKRKRIQSRRRAPLRSLEDAFTRAGWRALWRGAGAGAKGARPSASRGSPS